MGISEVHDKDYTGKAIATELETIVHNSKLIGEIKKISWQETTGNQKEKKKSLCLKTVIPILKGESESGKWKISLLQHPCSKAE